MTGDPIPYTYLDDNFFVGLLLGCFFCFVWALINKKSYLLRLFQAFFVDRDLTSIQGGVVIRPFHLRVLLFILACADIGILLFCLQADNGHTAVVSYKIIGEGALIAAAFYLSKKLLYFIVNGILFSKSQVAQWSQSYSASFTLIGSLFYLLSIVHVFLSLSQEVLTTSAFILLIISEIVLFFKAFHIFFAKKHGCLQLIIYFCALEIMPFLLAWKAFVLFSNQLTLNF